MILYNEARATFHLQGPTYSYILAVHEGVLINRYWGAKLPVDGNNGPDGVCVFVTVVLYTGTLPLLSVITGP